MPSELTKALLASGGAVVAAIGSALCCAGPLVAVFLGASGAGLAATFEPVRPLFVGGTVVSLATAFAVLHREERRACEPGAWCASPRVLKWMKRSVWIAAALAMPLLSFPLWSTFLYPSS
jgi:mercuric ion transport protein